MSLSCDLRVNSKLMEQLFGFLGVVTSMMGTAVLDPTGAG